MTVIIKRWRYVELPQSQDESRGRTLLHFSVSYWILRKFICKQFPLNKQTHRKLLKKHLKHQHKLRPSESVFYTDARSYSLRFIFLVPEKSEGVLKRNLSPEDRRFTRLGPEASHVTETEAQFLMPTVIIIIRIIII